MSRKIELRRIEGTKDYIDHSGGIYTHSDYIALAMTGANIFIDYSNICTKSQAELDKKLFQMVGR